MIVRNYGYNRQVEALRKKAHEFDKKTLRKSDPPS